MKYIIETNGDNVIKDVEGEQACVAVGGYMLIGKLHLYTEPEWIPYNEKHPDKVGLYLVTAKNNKEPRVYCWYGTNWSVPDDTIIAWMPLPAAYGESKLLPVIGDEVIKQTDDTKAAVLYLINDDGDCIVFTENGRVERWDAEIFERTGVNHPQIADMLEELQEGEE